MKRKILISVFFGLVLIVLGFIGNCWINTQPLWVNNKKISEHLLNKLPARNRLIIEFIEANGSKIAPHYNDAVCTEFVIDVIEQFGQLTKEEKKGIRIITDKNLVDLVESESSIIKGVQTSLIQNNKGEIVEGIEDVMSGDFVQFWNVYQGKAYGHCGVILEVNPSESLTVYSSHPLTDGYGKQKFLWPDKAFFVRLN